MRSTDFPFAVMPQRLQVGGRAKPLSQQRREREEKTARMFEDPMQLGRGLVEGMGTAGRYLRSAFRDPSRVPRDVASLGGSMYEGIKEDPGGFVADALLAPLAAVRDVGDIRALAREAREAGDEEQASNLEQLAALSVVGGVPIAGPLLARAVRQMSRRPAAGAGLAVKPEGRAFTVTPEETPGKSAAHRADIQSGTPQTRARYQGAAPWQRDRQDVLYAARDIPTATRPGTGAYINSANELEMNPVNLTSFPLPDVESRMPEIEALEKFRGVIDAQEAMAGNMPVPTSEGNALFFNMGRAPSESEMAFLARNTPGGFGSTATTGGAMTFPFDPGMAASEAQGAMTSWRDLARRYLGAEPESVRNVGFYTPALGKFDDDYNVIPTKPFSGEATMSVLEDFSKLDPSVAQSLAGSADVRDVLGQKYLRDVGAPTARADIQNTRQFFSDPRWAEAVELIRRGMPPAAALAALGYSASALAGETPE